MIIGTPNLPMLDIPVGPKMVQNTTITTDKPIHAHDQTDVAFLAPNFATYIPPIVAKAIPMIAVILPSIVAA